MAKLFQLGEYHITAIVTSARWRENCYVVQHLPSGEQALIDPGDDADAIVRVVCDAGARLRHILLTHAHFDHVGAVAALCRHFDLSCSVHKQDVRLLRQAPMYALRFGHQQMEPPGPFWAFEGQTTFQLGARPIPIMHTPGHSPGGVCYDFGNFIFTGDILVYQRLGRTDLPGGDEALLRTSVSRLVDSLPCEAVVFPGHGRPWTIAEARAWWREVVRAQ